jgi:alpha-tubulin suppressor-like RCC1 family protein
MTGLPTITAIAAGPAATFLLDSSKTVWVCGICPDGTTRTRPERIPGAVNIKAMSGEFDHALFLREDGKVMAYGANGYGELGDGTQERRNTLVQTQGVTQAIQVAAGGRFSLALTRSGTVLGWGANGVGQLGDGIPLFYMQGYHVASFPAWKEITGGASHVLALRPDNTVWAWGRSSQGQLGIGDKLPRSAPVQVMPDAIAVAAGREHSLTIRSDGTLWGWGNNNAGALSDNLSRLIDFPSPTQIPGQSGVIAVACKESLSGVVHANGVVQFWGDPFRGEPYTVTVPNAVAISAECGKIYILTSQGKVWVPRFHTTGLVAGEIQELNSVVAIASGYSHTLFLKSDGTVWAGGSNESGELGDAPAEAAHRQVSGLNHVCSIAAGRSFSLALKRDGSVWAWGSNSDGQLGDGTRIDRARPQRVKGVRRAFAISACGSAGLALCLPEGVHLNNDASPDLLWHNPQTGKIVYWYLDGTTKLSYETLSLGSGAPWQIVGTPDMNGDGKTDILWYNPGTGQLVVWYMQGITRLGYALYGTQVVAPWRVAAVYDANDDGKPDLLWHNPQTGQLTLWYMDNMRRVGAVAVTNTAATPWEVAGIADFNQDGNPDILWHNPLAGMVYLWFMQAEQYLGRQLVASEIFAPWRIVGTPDLNQDGFPDILWHNPAASPLAVWYMRGFIRTGSARLSDGVFAPWQVVRGN